VGKRWTNTTSVIGHPIKCGLRLALDIPGCSQGSHNMWHIYKIEDANPQIKRRKYINTGIGQRGNDQFWLYQLSWTPWTTFGPATRKEEALCIASVDSNTPCGVGVRVATFSGWWAFTESIPLDTSGRPDPLLLVLYPTACISALLIHHIVSSDHSSGLGPVAGFGSGAAQVYHSWGASATFPCELLCVPILRPGHRGNW